jgi:NAD(P)-dependent dehydrogenase (short-subunit alcohol dehydrogenase family)
MKVDLNNRVALVTGAAGAIGRAIALALAENGATVAVNDLNNPAGTCREILQLSGRAKSYQCDISDAAAVELMVAAVESELGPVDILVNNAGVNVGKNRAPLHDFEDDEWHRIVRVDLDGVFYCSRAVSKRMLKWRRGSVINIASVFGIVPARMQCAFAAAKAGTINLTRSQALELGRDGIRVNAIAPGSILTEGTRSLFYNAENKQKSESLLSHIPLGRPGDTSDVAAAVLYLASDDAKYVTGHVLVVDGGWTAGFSRDW